MLGYFDNGKPIYGWFRGLQRVITGMRFSFGDRSAVHLDLVQESTKPAWSKLLQIDRPQAEMVLKRDKTFLHRQLEDFSLCALICTSSSVCKNVCTMLKAERVAGGDLRTRWSIWVARHCRGRVGIAGWNIPLARATGLGREGETQLGMVLRRGLEAAKIPL